MKNVISWVAILAESCKSKKSYFLLLNLTRGGSFRELQTRDYHPSKSQSSSTRFQKIVIALIETWLSENHKSPALAIIVIALIIPLPLQKSKNHST